MKVCIGFTLILFSVMAWAELPQKITPPPVKLDNPMPPPTPPVPPPPPEASKVPAPVPPGDAAPLFDTKATKVKIEKKKTKMKDRLKKKVDEVN